MKTVEMKTVDLRDYFARACPPSKTRGHYFEDEFDLREYKSKEGARALKNRLLAGIGTRVIKSQKNLILALIDTNIVKDYEEGIELMSRNDKFFSRLCFDDYSISCSQRDVGFFGGQKKKLFISKIINDRADVKYRVSFRKPTLSEGGF